MIANIDIKVTVYLYEQVTTFNTGERNEVITYANVYPTKEEAMKALRCGEYHNIEDGMPYESIMGTSYQYHQEYDRNDGDHVWEIRRETRMKVDGGWIMPYEACRVIEKKF